MRSPIVKIVLAVAAVMLLIVLIDAMEWPGDRTDIRKRVRGFREALSSGDTNHAFSFLLTQPARTDRDPGNLGFMYYQLGKKNSSPAIRFIGTNRADVVCQRKAHWGIIPGGNALEMIKTNGQWYFTGGVNID